ncbi:MAG: aromatic ring-opening dioxygenase LigA [Acidimicrobiia bacterium]|nr:MAG: aromatic ring-opening dioxygenase LigA [Acidimicrobiia bacterium]
MFHRRRRSTVAALGRLVSLAGLGSAVAGAVAWATVSSRLAGEKIVVPDGAPHLGGRPVRGPLTAFAQAEAINGIAMKATGGRVYAELDQDDPAAETARVASFLRASLFTSVLAFGVAAGQMAVGLVLMLIGKALRETGDRL